MIDANDHDAIHADIARMKEDIHSIRVALSGTGDGTGGIIGVVNQTKTELLVINQRLIAIENREHDRIAAERANRRTFIATLLGFASSLGVALIMAYARNGGG